jgi:DNA invertase Pin-like site-specific DNA recombinase
MLEIIGYTRVSTELQLQCGDSLSTQVRKIREYAREYGFKVISIHQDVESARNLTAYQQLPGLNDAVKDAKRLGIPILVTTIDRLSRSVTMALTILDKARVPLISVSHHHMPRLDVLRQVVQAQAAGDQIRDKTRETAVRKRERGEDLGCAGALKTGRLNSARNRRFKHDEKVREIANVMVRHPACLVMKRAELVDYLNSIQLTNTRGKPWTYSSLMRFDREAREHAALNSEDWDPEDIFRKVVD